jgi:hypothetical protein
VKLPNRKGSGSNDGLQILSTYYSEKTILVKYKKVEFVGNHMLCGAGFPACLFQIRIMVGWKACPTRKAIRASGGIDDLCFTPDAIHATKKK